MAAKAQDKTILVNGQTIEMVRLDGGTFKMGLPLSIDKDDYWDNSRPVHDVTLSTFYIAKYAVTQELWVAVMGELDNPSIFWGKKNLPMECVNWYDAMEFIEKLNTLTGETFTLPTEAQFEFATRGGLKFAPKSNKLMKKLSINNYCCPVKIK